MVLKRFITEVIQFSRNNWWVYIIYCGLLSIVFLVDKDHFLFVTLISFLHFIADIFIMMMFTAYNNSNYREGAYFQITSMLLFLTLKIVTGFTSGAWYYLAADPVYMLAAIKNYQIDVRKRDIPLINRVTMSWLSLLILAGLFSLQGFFKATIFIDPAQWIQTLGIFLFAIALSTTGHERQRYSLSIVALSAMVVGSGWETYVALQGQRLTGLALSYFLLPLTVLVFYSRHWSDYMGKHTPTLSK